MDNQELFGKFVTLISSLRELESDLAQGIDHGGTTPVQYRFLQVLHFHGPSSLGSVAGCVDLSLPNASREAKKLVALGYVTKGTDPDDRRVTRIGLTPGGQALVKVGLEAMAVEFFRRTGTWPADRAARASAALQALGEVLGL